MTDFITDRRLPFFWGLSNGVVVLAVAGAFWLGVAAWYAPQMLFIAAALVLVCVLGAFVLAARRLRARAQGFHPGAKNLSEAWRAEGRRVRNHYLVVVVLEVLGIWLAVALCLYFKRPDLIVPCIAIVVSLHFAPLASLFQVRAYYFTAAAGTAAALGGLITDNGVARSMVVGTALAVVMWVSAWYLLANAELLAEKQVTRFKDI